MRFCVLFTTDAHTASFGGIWLLIMKKMRHIVSHKLQSTPYILQRKFECKANYNWHSLKLIMQSQQNTWHGEQSSMTPFCSKVLAGNDTIVQQTMFICSEINCHFQLVPNVWAIHMHWLPVRYYLLCHSVVPCNRCKTQLDGASRSFGFD